MLPEQDQLEAGYELQSHFQLEKNPVEDEASYRILQTKFDHSTELNWKIETMRNTNGATYVAVSMFKVRIDDDAPDGRNHLRLALEGILFRHQAELPLAERVAFVLAISKAAVKLAAMAADQG